MTIGARAVGIARGWIGTPYVHQGSARGAGTDCLGLIRGVWRELYGTEPELPPPYTADWGEIGGAAEGPLLAAATRNLVAAGEEGGPGQVLLFRMRGGAVAKHLGILSETGDSFIHAYDRHGVVESPLSAPWRARIVARFRWPEP